MTTIKDWKPTPSWKRPPALDKDEAWALCIMWFLIGAGAALAMVETVACLY